MNKRLGMAQDGFTLLEIMISLVLICLVVVSVIQLSSANLRNIATSDNQIEALGHANAKMREVLDLDTLEDKTWQDIDADGYSYDISISEILKERSDDLPVKLLDIKVSTQYTKDKRSKQVMLQTAKMVSKADSLKSH